MIGLALATLFITAAAAPQSGPAPCATWQECQTMALDAAGRQQYEVFHDLSWRALQKGPKNDPGLMQMLARAQSLSGRPLDALVMLERMAALGLPTDAATSEDFRRVRDLPGWADFETRLAQPSPAPAPGGSTPGEAGARAAPNASRALTPVAPVTSPVAPPAAMVRSPRGRSGRGSTRLERNATSATAALSAPAGAAGAAGAPVVGDAAEALRFTTVSFTPAGLAYDPVSDRFIVGDRDGRKLTVVDEASQRVANLAGAVSAGFGPIGALEIDPREGDLWVVTGEPATLHRLQLISGRLLEAVPLQAALGPARFADVAVLPHGGVIVLDAMGRRLLVAPAKSHRLDLAAQFEGLEPASVAPESDAVAYLAHAGGISRVDLVTGRARVVTGPAGVPLGGFTRLRWHRGGLVGVQAVSDGTYSILRLKLDAAGSRVTSVATLDRAVRMRDPSAAALSADVLYYLAEPSPAAEPGVQAETIVRRVTIR